MSLLLPERRLANSGHGFDGTDAGLTMSLRRQYMRYLGIEVELNQGSLQLLRRNLRSLIDTMPGRPERTLL